MNSRYELKQQDNNFAMIFRLDFKVIVNQNDLSSEDVILRSMFFLTLEFLIQKSDNKTLMFFLQDPDFFSNTAHLD